MYTRLLSAKVQVKDKEPFLDLMQEYSDTILDHCEGRLQFMRNLQDEEEWIILEQYESLETYQKYKSFVEADFKENSLARRMDELLIEPLQPLDDEYYMYMEVESEPEDNVPELQGYLPTIRDRV